MKHVNESDVRKLLTIISDSRNAAKGGMTIRDWKEALELHGLQVSPPTLRRIMFDAVRSGTIVREQAVLPTLCGPRRIPVYRLVVADAIRRELKRDAAETAKRAARKKAR